MRRYVAIALGLVCLFAAAVVVAEDKETPDDSYPSVLAITFRADKAKDCKDLETMVAKVRSQLEDKQVLFLTADVTSRASRHQTKLLLNVLGLEDVWKAHAKTPARLVLVEVSLAKVFATFGAKDGDKAVVEAVNKRMSSEMEDDSEESDDDDGGGEDEEDDG